MTRGRLGSERGSVSALVIVAAMALLFAVGLVVDGGGQASAAQRTERAASEAARAAGQQLTGTTVGGGGPTLATQRAIQAAQAHLATEDVTGTVSLSGDVITVRTTDSYEPKIVPLPTLTVTGQAEVRLGQT